MPKYIRELFEKERQHEIESIKESVFDVINENNGKLDIVDIKWR